MTKTMRAVSMKRYAEMTTTERRSYSATRAAVSRAQDKVWQAYADRFGGVFGLHTVRFVRLMERALRSGVDHPELVEYKRDWAVKVRTYQREAERKRAELLARPLTADIEAGYTGLIKKRRLFEGACNLAWQNYFEYRHVHADEVAPLTEDDLAYVSQWTSYVTAARPLENSTA